MNYYFLDVSTHHKAKNKAEELAVNVMSKFHQILVGANQMKVLIEYWDEKMEFINQSFKNCTNMPHRVDRIGKRNSYDFGYDTRFCIHIRLVQQDSSKTEFIFEQCLLSPELNIKTEETQ